MSLKIKKASLRAGVALVGLIAAGGASAQTRTFDVPSDEAVNSIPEFAQQAGVQIVAPADRLEGVKTPAVRGSMDVHVALADLLSGTNFRVASDDGQIITLKSPSKNVVAADPDTGGGASAASGGIETVVVTAEKRSENLKDVPISVVAVGSEDMTKREINSIDNLLTVVPGLSIQHTTGQRRINIDGVSNVFGNAAVTGVYIDDASVTSDNANQLDLETADLHDVEVLKGPQGTLYGEGSMGGTIKFVTNPVDLENFEFSAHMEGSFTQGGGPSEIIQPVVNIPLIDGVLGLRVAGTLDHEGGWIQDPTNNLRDINDQNKTDIRTKILFQPSDQLTIKFMMENHRNNMGNELGEQANDTWAPIPPLNAPSRIQDNYDLYNLTGTYDFGFASLLTTTTYVKQWQTLTNGANTLPLSGPIGQFPLYAQAYALEYQFWNNFNEEVRLQSDPDSALKWDVGYFYRAFDNEYTIPTYDAGFENSVNESQWIALNPALYDYYGYSTSRASSYFGNISYKFFDRLTVGAGIRYYQDTITFTNNATPANPNAPYGPEATPPASFQKGNDHSLDPRFDIDFAATDNVNIYADVGKGFRSGGFNALDQPKYGPEEVWRYELGVKGAWFDNRLSGDLSVFYSSYNDYIIVGLSPPPTPENIYSNAGDAKIEGVEWNFTWIPVDQWTIRFNGDYLDTAFTKISINPISSSPYRVGDDIDMVSPYQGTLSVERDFTVHGKQGYIIVDYNRQAPETYRLRNEGPWYYAASNHLSILNFHTELQWNDTLSFGVFGNNLLNDQGYLNPFIMEHVADKERPRTFGIDATVHFN